MWRFLETIPHEVDFDNLPVGDDQEATFLCQAEVIHGFLVRRGHFRNVGQTTLCQIVQATAWLEAFHREGWC